MCRRSHLFKALSVGLEWEQYVQVLWEFVDSVGTSSASSGPCSSKTGLAAGSCVGILEQLERALFLKEL